MAASVIEIDIGCGILGSGRKKVLTTVIISILPSGYRTLNAPCWWLAMTGAVSVRIILLSERNGLGDLSCLIAIGINESVASWLSQQSQITQLLAGVSPAVETSRAPVKYSVQVLCTRAVYVCVSRWCNVLTFPEHTCTLPPLCPLLKPFSQGGALLSRHKDSLV